MVEYMVVQDSLHIRDPVKCIGRVPGSVAPDRYAAQHAPDRACE